MTFKKSNYQDGELNSSIKSDLKSNNRRHLVIYAFRKTLYYLTLLYGVIAILYLILIFPSRIWLEITNFFLYFTLILCIIYGLVTFVIHLLQKSYIKEISGKSRDDSMPITRINPELANNLLQGKTLQVYWYIFTHNQAGIREIQKALNFTSSGTVSYQVTKLLNAGIIFKDEVEGKYTINKEIKIGVLKFFIRIGNRMFPRIALYLIVYVLGFTVFLLLVFISGYGFVWNPLNLFLLLLLVIGIIIFVIESLRIWKLNPTK
ncbi:MAG: hypothetical protein ACFE96_00705 [Candidatus Hermodarchaeota archaeon]